MEAEHHEVLVAAGRQASGVYQCPVVVGTKIETRKSVVMK